MTVRTLFTAALAAAAYGAAAEIPFAIDRPAEFDPAKAGWRKVFEDDFDGPEVDWREKWVQPYYDARPRELAETDGEGHLRIKVDFEPGSTNRLRSTSLYTRQAFGCGYYEARVKFTSQNGFWSAFQIGGDANANPFLDGFALDGFEAFRRREDKRDLIFHRYKNPAPAEDAPLHYGGIVFVGGKIRIAYHIRV